MKIPNEQTKSRKTRKTTLVIGMQRVFLTTTSLVTLFILRLSDLSGSSATICPIYVSTGKFSDITGRLVSNCSALAPVEDKDIFNGGSLTSITCMTKSAVAYTC